MAITDSEKLDRILKAYVQEVQSWENDNFQYAMARSDVSEERAQEERTQENSAELLFVMRKRPRDFDFLLKRITKLTAKYSRKYKIALQTAFRWEDEDPAALENESFCKKMG